MIRSNDLNSRKEKIVATVSKILKVCEETEKVSLDSSKFNHKKTAFITRLKHDESIKVKIRSQDIKETDIALVQSFKLLGVNLDYNLTFKIHIDRILRSTKSALLQVYKFARRLPFFKSRYIWYGAILPLAIYNIANWITTDNFDKFVNGLQILQNMWIRLVTRLEIHERPNIKNVAIELNYMPIYDKVLQLLYKAENRAKADVRVKSLTYSENSSCSKMLSTHSTTKFSEIRKVKNRRNSPHTKKNLTNQWFLEWKTERHVRNKAIVDDLSPPQRLLLYSKLSILESRSILRARSDNLLTQVTRYERGFDVVPLCHCLLEKDSSLHLLAVCPLLNQSFRLRLREEMTKQDMPHPLSCPDCYPIIHSLLRSDPRLFPREPD
jgi:hypothetical protein